MSANTVGTGTVNVGTNGTLSVSDCCWHISVDSISGSTPPPKLFTSTAADSTISFWWDMSGAPVFLDTYTGLAAFVSDMEKLELESDFQIAPACLLELVRKITEDHEFREKLEQSMAYLLLKSSHISVWMLSVCLEKAPSLDSKQEKD